MEESDSMEKNGFISGQCTPDNNYKFLNSEYDQLPYLTNWQYSNSGEDRVQMFTNDNLEFDIRDVQRDSQADMTTSSATACVEPCRDYQNLFLGSATAMDQPGYFDESMTNPTFLNFDNHGNGFENLALSTSEYTQVGEDFAPSDLEYTQEGGFWSSLSQNQAWDDDSALISYPNFEELFGQTKE